MTETKTFFNLLLGEVTGAPSGAWDHVGEANAVLQQPEIIKGSEGFGDEARQVHALPWQRQVNFLIWNWFIIISFLYNDFELPKNLLL